jgi:zinc transporter
MTESLLVTARHRPLSAIDATRKALRSGRKVATVAALMDTIVEYVVDAIERYADGVASKLDHIEERILADDMSEGRNMLGRIRRTTVRPPAACDPALAHAALRARRERDTRP